MKPITNLDLLAAEIEASALGYKVFRTWKGPEARKRHYVACARRDMILAGVLYRFHKCRQPIDWSKN